MLHSTGTRGYYLRNNDLLLHLGDLNNDLLFHSTGHLDALLKITCSKQCQGALSLQTTLRELKMIGAFTRKIIFHFGNLRSASARIKQFE